MVMSVCTPTARLALHFDLVDVHHHRLLVGIGLVARIAPRRHALGLQQAPDDHRIQRVAAGELLDAPRGAFGELAHLVQQAVDPRSGHTVHVRYPHIHSSLIPSARIGKSADPARSHDRASTQTGGAGVSPRASASRRSRSNRTATARRYPAFERTSSMGTTSRCSAASPSASASAGLRPRRTVAVCVAQSGVGATLDNPRPISSITPPCMRTLAARPTFAIAWAL